MSDSAILSARQEKLLAAVIEQYAEVAAPVGSSLLAKAFDVSSATIRSEMAELERQGFIKQPHTSAGRIPTDKGYRHYVNNLNQDGGEKTSRQAYAIERQINDSGEAEQAIKNAVQALADATNNLSIGVWNDRVYQAGLSSLFSQPEFFGGTQAREVARLVEGLPQLIKLIYDDQKLHEDDFNRTTVYIGEENPIFGSANATSIISRIKTPNGFSFVGVVGPTRQNYGRVHGLVEYVSKALETAL